jgi:hypothetical protein
MKRLKKRQNFLVNVSENKLPSFQACGIVKLLNRYQHSLMYVVLYWSLFHWIDGGGGGGDFH